MKKAITLIIMAVVSVLVYTSCETKGNNKDNQNENKVVQEKPEILVPTGPVLVMETSLGNIKFQLFDETPKHRDNFIKLAEEKFYEGTLFHRVIKEFMIQGGDPDSKDAKPGQILGEGGPGYQIDAEFVKGIIHKKGALATAREGDDVNPEKKSAGSQFYIVQGKIYDDKTLAKIEKKMKIKLTEKEKEIYKTIGGTPFLDQNYTVFGEVIEGLDIVDSIAAVSTDKNDRPLEDIIIKSLTVIEK